MANVGDIVQAAYKTGEYVGEVIELRPPFAIVKILAVLEHPAQGDLHQPMQTNVDFFHQRRALAHEEKARVHQTQLQPYTQQIPSYKESLRQALDKQIAELENMGQDPWAKQSLQHLTELKKDYGF